MYRVALDPLLEMLTLSTTAMPKCDEADENILIVKLLVSSVAVICSQQYVKNNICVTQRLLSLIL